MPYIGIFAPSFWFKLMILLNLVFVVIGCLNKYYKVTVKIDITPDIYMHILCL